MILLDYNGIAVGNIVTQKLELNEDLLRSMILNSIRLYRNKFKKQYGEVVICADAGGNWRKEFYPEYKASRGTDREASTFDWDKAFDILNTVRDEIVENMPYKVIQIHKCEADDVIGVLAEHTQGFGNYEPMMICSADKDFAQLQKWSNIKQFSTRTKKFIVEPNPRDTLFEHVCRGDGSDGVPNVLSDDRVFITEGTRQTPLSKVKIAKWKAAEDMRAEMGEDIYRNYQRNELMIDLSNTPQVLKDEIINTFNDTPIVPSSKVMPYFIKKRCRVLMENLGDFI